MAYMSIIAYIKWFLGKSKKLTKAGTKLSFGAPTCGLALLNSNL